MKKYALSIFAVLLAVGFSAFTTTPPEKPQFRYWYSLEGEDYGHGLEPEDAVCALTGSGCAKGFNDVPGDPINDPEDATRGEN